MLPFVANRRTSTDSDAYAASTAAPPLGPRGMAEPASEQARAAARHPIVQLDADVVNRIAAGEVGSLSHPDHPPPLECLKRAAGKQFGCGRDAN